MENPDSERQRYDEIVCELLKDSLAREKRENSRFMFLMVSNTLASMLCSACIGFVAGAAFSPNSKEAHQIYPAQKQAPEIYCAFENKNLSPTNIFKHPQIYY